MKAITTEEQIPVEEGEKVDVVQADQERDEESAKALDDVVRDVASPHAQEERRQRVVQEIVELAARQGFQIIAVPMQLERIGNRYDSHVLNTRWTLVPFDSAR